MGARGQATKLIIGNKGARDSASSKGARYSASAKKYSWATGRRLDHTPGGPAGAVAAGRPIADVRPSSRPRWSGPVRSGAGDRGTP